MKKSCTQCALQKLQNKCPIFNKIMNYENGCPLFVTELKKCELCGQVMTDPGIIVQGENNYHLICSSCNKLNDCAFCENSYCAFQQDSTCQLPLYTTVTQRQGNMTVQQQVQNPERVKALCFTCSCWNEEDFKCNRTNYSCNKYKCKLG